MQGLCLHINRRHLHMIKFHLATRECLTTHKVMSHDAQIFIFKNYEIFCPIIRETDGFHLAMPLADCLRPDYRTYLRDKHLEHKHGLTDYDRVNLKFPLALDVFPQLPSVPRKAGRKIPHILLYSIRQFPPGLFHRTKEAVKLAVA